MNEEAQPHVRWVVTLGIHQFLVELKIIRKIIIIIIIITIMKKRMVVKVTKDDEEDGDVNDNNDEEEEDGDDFYCWKRGRIRRCMDCLD